MLAVTPVLFKIKELILVASACKFRVPLFESVPKVACAPGSSIMFFPELIVKSGDEPVG